MSLLIPETGLIFWMTISFGVVLFILYRYGFPIIVRMVEERRQFIDKSLQDAHEANKQLVNASTEREKLLSAAREEQLKIIREATKSGEKIISDARDEARRVSSLELEKAREELLREREDSLRKIRNEMAVISLATAEKILRKTLDNRDSQLEMINSILDENIDLRS